MLEIEVGDVATFDLTDEELHEKDRREQEARRIILERLSQISPNTADSLKEYEKQNTDEAVFVRMVDKLLPVAVDVTGDGLRIMREDFGINNLKELEKSHDQLFSLTIS